MQLSEHFDSSEFDCHDGTPVPPWAIRDYKRLCHRMLEPLRDRFGRCRVVSGYRTRAHNRAVGGARRSYHVVTRRRPGAAADVTFERGTPHEWALAAASIGHGGIHAYETWLHVDNRRGDARW
jgi:uncharacterized protein YcbK (DUF882 family)